VQGIHTRIGLHDCLTGRWAGRGSHTRDKRGFLDTTFFLFFSLEQWSMYMLGFAMHSRRRALRIAKPAMACLVCGGFNFSGSQFRGTSIAMAFVEIQHPFSLALASARLSLSKHVRLFSRGICSCAGRLYGWHLAAMGVEHGTPVRTAAAQTRLCVSCRT
jgi:hypothetical protein